MSTSVTAAEQPTVAGRVHVLGRVTLVAGLLGAASAVVIVAWPAEVSDQDYSYPFDATTYAVAQSWFAVQHLGLLAGLVALSRLARPASSRVTRGGLALGMVGMFGLTGCELFAITAADDLVGSSAADAVDNSYGAPMVAIGLGLVVAGIGLARHRVLAGRGRWLPLALGVYVFVPMFPAVFGPLVLGRIAIGGWMLLFAALGGALLSTGGARS